MFRICGAVYHNIGSIQHFDDNKPIFSQLYIYDPDFQLKTRIENAAKSEIKLSKTLLKDLQQLMYDLNPYIKQLTQFYKHYKDSPTVDLVLKTNEQISKDKNITITIQKTLTEPTANEISGIVPGNFNFFLIYDSSSGL